MRVRFVASVVLTIAGAIVLLAGLFPSGASSGAGDTPATQPGSAFASSVVLGVNPEYGGFSLAVRAGEATASYTASQSTATSDAINGGYLVSSLVPTGPNACVPGSSSSSASPTAAVNGLEITSDNGASTSTGDGGIESVAVNPSPESANGTTSLLPIIIPDLLSVTSKAVAKVNYVNGRYQEADAQTTIGLSLLNGLVVLNGLSWSASQSDGTQNASTTSFSLGSISVFGKTMTVASPSDLTQAIAAANKVLTLAGITLSLPTESTDSVTGAVTIGPLQLQLAGTTLFNTVLHQIAPAQQQLDDEIAAILEKSGNACIQSLAADLGVGELVAGIVEGILAGAGTIDLQIGGASANTQVAPNYANPLDATNPLAGSGTGSSLPSSLPFSGGGSLGTSSGPISSSTAPGASPQAAPPAPSRAKSSATALIRCVSTSPAGGSGCSAGSDGAALGALLLGAGVLFAADFVRSRRRLARPKETL